MESGSDLSSRAVTSQVLSTCEGLTAVFGMGTGVAPQPLPPENGYLVWVLAHLHNCTEIKRVGVFVALIKPSTY